MIVDDDQDRSASTIDKPPMTLIAEARELHHDLLAAPHHMVASLAEALGKCRKRSAQLLKVAMLAPDIIARCIAGTQPVSLTTKLLLNMELPIRWKQQRILLGIGCVQISQKMNAGRPSSGRFSSCSCPRAAAKKVWKTGPEIMA